MPEILFELLAITVMSEPKPIDVTNIIKPKNTANVLLESRFTFVFINLPPF